ncbi:nicotinate phosphoribosyltransferase [Klebsiella michiganensis]|uniref:Nicotinate phosphoribosyltransferase n=1 Tax=Klebsiella michiganensis TaxID=1134687 RepID=A0A7H4N2I8_9ENTR|nr:nicotinate phosphoribosyltransferase [Klebsiella michiganensis]
MYRLRRSSACRGDDLLGIYADAIREQVETMRDLRLQDDEYHWLSSLPFFAPDYLEWLRGFRYDPRQVTVINDNGKLNIRLSGPWLEVIMWEVPLLAVISELVHRYRSPEISVDLALDTLEHKLTDFNRLTADIDMSGFRPDGFRYPPPLLPRGAAGDCSVSSARILVHRYQQLRSGAAFEFDPNGDPGSRMVPGASADQPEPGEQPARGSRCLAGRVSRFGWGLR